MATTENMERLEAVQVAITTHEAAIKSLEQEERRLEQLLRQHYGHCELLANEVQRLTLLRSHTDEMATTVYQELLAAAQRLYRKELDAREEDRQAHGRIMDALREHYGPLALARQNLLQLQREQQE